jgi:hypothetical protein
MLYKAGLQREAGIVHSASVHSGDLLRGLIAGSLGLVALLAVSGIAAERSTVADAVLCRGISRHQYFLAKWHARLAIILMTFAGLAGVVLLVHHFVLDPDLTLVGGATAVLLVASALMVLVSLGVTIGALAPGTVMGITLLWVLLYGGFTVLEFLPESYPTPERILSRLKFVLRGEYDGGLLPRFALASCGISVAAAIVGLIGFSRKDV